MTVFKGYLTIMKRNMGFLLMYFCLFSAIVISIQAVYVKKEEGKAFENTRLNIAFIDRDNSVLSKQLCSYMENLHHVRQLPDDKSVLQEEMFYGKLDYVAIIPKGFSIGSNKKANNLQVTKLPGSYEGSYVDQQVNSFLSRWKMLESAGYEEGELIGYFEGESNELVTDDIELMDLNGNGGRASGYLFMFRYFPYLFICTLCYSVTIVLIAFREKEVRKRMLASSLSFKKQNIQGIIGLFCIALIVGALSFLMPIVVYGKEFLNAKNIGYYILNVGVQLLVAFALAFAIGVLVHSTKVLSNIVNVVGLGMCFLGGVFVDLSMLGEGVKQVAKFLPTYWYEVNNEILGKFELLEGVAKSQYLQGILLQVLFAVAFLGIGLVAIKFQQQERG